MYGMHTIPRETHVQSRRLTEKLAIGFLHAASNKLHPPLQQTYLQSAVLTDRAKGVSLYPLGAVPFQKQLEKKYGLLHAAKQQTVPLLFTLLGAAQLTL